MLKVMKVSAVACAVVWAMASGATAQTNAQRLAGGTWACAALADDLNVLSKQAYTSDGKSRITVMAFGISNGVTVKIAGEGEGVWTIVGDQLDETLSYLTVSFAQIGGVQSIETAQSMFDDMMVDVPLTNYVTFSGTTMFMKDSEGVETECVR